MDWWFKLRRSVGYAKSRYWYSWLYSRWVILTKLIKWWTNKSFTGHWPIRRQGINHWLTTFETCLKISCETNDFLWWCLIVSKFGKCRYNVYCIWGCLSVCILVWAVCHLITIYMLFHQTCVSMLICVKSRLEPTIWSWRPLDQTTRHGVYK